MDTVLVPGVIFKRIKSEILAQSMIWSAAKMFAKMTLRDKKRLRKHPKASSMGVTQLQATLTSIYHFYDKIQSTACTPTSTLPNEFMI